MEREVGKFMRKWICILLAAGIAAGLMSGCSRNVGTQESAVWQVLETEILAEKADASGEVDFTHDYSEEIKADIEDVVSKSESLQKELEQINTIIQKFTPLAEKAETQGEMNASSRWFYVIWDTELNNLWSRFMNLADQKTKESVLAEQRNWVGHEGRSNIAEYRKQRRKWQHLSSPSEFFYGRNYEKQSLCSCQ